MTVYRSLMESALTFNISIPHPRLSKQNNWVTGNAAVQFLWTLWGQEGHPDHSGTLSPPPSIIRLEAHIPTVYVSYKKALTPTAITKRSNLFKVNISVAFGVQTIGYLFCSILATRRPITTYIYWSLLMHNGGLCGKILPGKIVSPIFPPTQVPAQTWQEINFLKFHVNFLPSFN